MRDWSAGILPARAVVSYELAGWKPALQFSQFPPVELCRSGRYDSVMSESYRQLLDATIQHLEGMQARGVRHVAVTPESLRALALPAGRLVAASPRPQIQRPAFGAPVSDPARSSWGSSFSLFEWHAEA